MLTFGVVALGVCIVDLGHQSPESG